MIYDDGFWANNVNTSIGDLIDAFPKLMNEFSFVLITSLDSSNELDRDKMIRETSLPHSFLGNGVLFEAKLIPELGRLDGFFSGFDEIWCYKQKITIPKPKEVYFIGPYSPTKPISNPVKQWMRESQCILGLGDGVGLNYITSERRIADLIERELE